MKLLTKAILKSMPKLYATENIPLKEKEAVCKFFDPCGAYTAYIVEGEEQVDEDGNVEDFTMFGWVTFGDPDCAEFGYVSLNELKSVKGRLNLGIERDLWFSKTKLKDIPEIKIYDTEEKD